MIGDIQQSDLDLLKKGYKWMTTASFVSFPQFLPIPIALKATEPVINSFTLKNGITLPQGGDLFRYCLHSQITWAFTYEEVLD